MRGDPPPRSTLNDPPSPLLGPNPPDGSGLSQVEWEGRRRDQRIRHEARERVRQVVRQAEERAEREWEERREEREAKEAAKPREIGVTELWKPHQQSIRLFEESGKECVSFSS